MQAQFAAMQAQSDQYRSFAAMQQQFMTNLLGQLQTTVPNFHLDVPFPVFPNLNEPLNPTPNPYPAGNDNQLEEAEDDENLRDDQFTFIVVLFMITYVYLDFVSYFL